MFLTVFRIVVKYCNKSVSAQEQLLSARDPQDEYWFFVNASGQEFQHGPFLASGLLFQFL